LGERLLCRYGRNWVPANGEYALQVRVELRASCATTRSNGCRFKNPVEIEFTSVKVERGAD
jgi:hypothetical protein